MKQSSGLVSELFLLLFESDGLEYALSVIANEMLEIKEMDWFKNMPDYSTIKS